MTKAEKNTIGLYAEVGAVYKALHDIANYVVDPGNSLEHRDDFLALLRALQGHGTPEDAFAANDRIHDYLEAL